MDIGVQTDPPPQQKGDRSPATKWWKQTYKIPLPKVLALILVLAVVFLLGYLAVQYLKRLDGGYSIPGALVEDMGMPGVVTFVKYDRDGDGVISIEEFEPLAHKFLEINVTQEYDLHMSEDEEVVTIQAFLQPLVLASLTKQLDSFVGPLDPLKGLKYWKKPVKDFANYGVGQFKLFLPVDNGGDLKLGQVYPLQFSMPDDLPPGSAFSSNRFYPPLLLEQEDRFMHNLLAMFHPHPFVVSRFAPQGGFACIRAYNDDVLEVVFRIHAEFQLNEPPFTPMWFTPGQFTGHLTISKDGKHVYDFHMYVPTEKPLNVDMEWLTHSSEAENMEVEIGFLPQMELVSAAPSQLLPPGINKKKEFVSANDNPDSPFTWSDHISMKQARRAIEKRFFPFKEVPYYDFKDAFKRAKAEQKLVHSVVLWGALDDQSC